MKRITSLLLSFFTIIVLFTSSCEKNNYYSRPDWLELPIYQQLEDKGDFTNYLAIVDKAGYKNTLSGSGYYTAFVPNDEAFERYFQQEGFASVNDIDTLTALNIVRYSLADNAYFKDEIDDYQNSSLDTTQRYDYAFRRRTSFYKWVYEEEVEGSTLKVVDQNGVNELPEEGPYFSSSDNNNKYIPYFTDNFLQTKKLSAYDYNYFYPDKEFNGFNVANAKTLEYDLRAENGVIHIIDEVIPPLPSLEDLVTGNSDYSAFYGLVEQYMLEYDLAPEDFLNRYAQVAGKSENVYIKSYDLLNFAPNCENFMKYSGNGAEHDAQKDSWTLFAPNNAATNSFINNVLLKHYNSLDAINPELIAEFINAHLFRSAVWPSKFESTLNYYGEPARFDPAADIIEEKIGSNGLFYGTNKIQKTDAFYTVLGEIILDPDYSLMLTALKSTNVYDILKNPDLVLTVFLLDNESFMDLGLTYNGATSSWELDNPALGSNANLALSRVVRMNIILGSEVESFLGDGLIQTYGGEYIRYQDGALYGAGNYQESQIVFPYKPNTDGTNGISYLVNGPLFYSTREIGYDIELNQASFGEFFNYLEKADMSLPGFVYDGNTRKISGIESEALNTLLIPTDTAMQRAVIDGYLPPITAANFTQAELEKVQKFIYYHTINGQLIVPGNEFSGTVRTLYETDDGATFLEVTSEEQDLVILDYYNRDVHLIYEKSNILSNNAVIHMLDSYLKYSKE